MAKRRVLEQISVVTGDEIRATIVSILNKFDHPIAYQKLKNQSESFLNRKISNGSFNWHLKMLRAEGIITKQSIAGYYLTKEGKHTASLLGEMLQSLARAGT